MPRRSVLPFVLSGYFLVITIGCGGASSPGNPVSPPAEMVTIRIAPTSATLPAGGMQPFQATVTGSTNTAVQWKVNGVVGGNSQLGTVSSTGLYTAPMSGPLQVRVTAVAAADTSKTATAAVTVNAVNNIITVSVSPASALLAVNGTQQFTAMVSGTDNAGVTWSVDGVTGGNSSVGTVSSSGLYTAPPNAGAHSVTASSVADSDSSAAAAVAVMSLSISPTSAMLVFEERQQFTASVQGTDNTGVSWSVDGVSGGNDTVGTITSSGLYAAPSSDGSHTVTATSNALTAYSVNAAVTVTAPPPGTVSVVTYHNDDARTGVNSNETILNLSNVNTDEFGKLAALPVDGQVYAQPLYLPNVPIDGVRHNVVFVATENDTVYAFDANAQIVLWQRHLGTPVPVNDEEGIKPLLGITSTPVIDATTGTIYVLAEGLENGHKVYRLHAMNVASGEERFGGPVVVTGRVPGNGWDSNNGQITLESSCYQRNGLALNPATNAVYIGFGHCNHGWLLAYDKATLQQTAILNVTPDGAGGGLWSGGGAPAIDDATGDMYIISGVDLGDPAPDYNDSALRLRGSDLSVLDYFKPSNEGFLRDNDADFGSGFPVLMPDNPSPYPHELIGGGKDGRVIVIDRDSMGQYQQNDHVIQEVQTGTQEFDNIFATPTYWKGTLYVHDEADVVRAYNWDSNTGLLSNSSISQGDDVYGTHGATSSLSSNGSSDGILWEIEATNAQSGAAAILHAYDASDLRHQLYKTSWTSGRDTAGPGVKFSVPTVADGHVFVGTQTELDIYGLLPQ